MKRDKFAYISRNGRHDGRRFRSYLSRDNGMHGGTAVADHEDKLGIWKEIENVGSHLEGKGILVA